MLSRSFVQLAAAAVITGTLVLAATTHAAVSAAWQPLSGGTQYGGMLVLDDTRHAVYTFGGDGTTLVRTVSLNGFPYLWGPLAATGTPPQTRTNGALVYDSAHDRLILFGGVAPDGTVLGDIWQLTLSGTPAWSALVTSGTGPDPRSDFGACYDTNHHVLYVFGGLDADGNLESNDLHALDLGATTPAWSTAAQSGAIPSARSGAPLAFDPDGNRLLLFGGNDGNSDLADEYELNLATFAWTSAPMTGSVPDPRSEHVCVWDNVSHLLDVWGGSAADDSLRSLDPATREWSAPTYFIGPPQHFAPSNGVYDWQWNRLIALAGPRGADLYTFWHTSPDGFWYLTDPITAPIAGSMVVDRANARIIAYGGLDGLTNQPMSEYWQFALTAPIGWNGVNTGGADPPLRQAHLAVWDQANARMLVIAGRDENGQFTNSVFALTDSADFMNWKGLATTGTPPSARMYPCGIYDPVGARVLMYGGDDVTNLRGGLYQLTTTGTPAWTTLVPGGGPTGRMAASAIYDEPRRRMILFGGADSVTGNYMNDVWSLSLPGLTWTKLNPTGTAPIGRWKHAAVYDSRRGRMIVFGGREATGDSADVWSLDLVAATPSWTRIVPAGFTPLFRSDVMAAYDSIGDRVVIRGGVSLITFNTAIAEEDVWALQFAGSTTAVDPSPQLPTVTMVGEPWPNPAHGTARLAFSLARPGPVRAAVFDLAGRQVATLADAAFGAGRHTLAWDGRDRAGRAVAGGLYFVHVELGGQRETRKLVVAP